MKKLFIATFISFASICSTETAYAVYINTMGSNNPIMTVNGLEYECHSPNRSVMGGKVYCNDVEISPMPSKKSHFAIKDIRKVVAKAVTGTIYIEQCQDPKNCIEGLTILGNISPLLKITAKGSELVFDSEKGFTQVVPVECRLTLKNLENIVNEGPAHIINTRAWGRAGSLTSANFGPGSISSTNNFYN